jgi:integrase
VPADRAEKKAHSSRRRRRVRGTGAPRLAAPGEPGNRSSNYAILWRDDGRPQSASTYTADAAQAAAFFDRWRAARARGQEAVTVATTLDAYVAAKRADHARKGRAPAVTKNLESKVARVRAFFGEVHPDELSAGLIDAYVEARRGDGVQDVSISSDLAYLRAALMRAWRRREIAMRPVVSTPGGAKPRKRALTRRELRTLAAALLDAETPLHLRTYVTLSLLTGQRGRHIRPLRWADVDFGEGMVWFSRSNPDAAANKQCSDVPMTEALARLLMDIREAARSHYVIEYQGRPLPRHDSLKRSWGNLRQRAGLPDLQMRDLRRSVATLAAEGGASLSAVAALLNNDEAITRRHYAHVSGALLDVVNRIDLSGEED